jgi:benzoyl-CoA reductase subunit C
MPERLAQVRENRHAEAMAWKEKTGGKVIGIFCFNVPEELIYAAGMLPVRLLGEKEEATEADLHFPTNCCPYPKRCFDQALKHRYDYLDGLVVPNVCDIIRAMYGTWKLNLQIPYVYFLEVPQRISPQGVEFFREMLEEFKKSLEAFSGREITEETLSAAIEIYDDNRLLLHQGYELRAQGSISAVEYQHLVISSMLLPKDAHNRLLEDCFEGFKGNPPVQSRVNLLVSASMLDDTDFLQLIEESGGAVVADDMPIGSRYFYYPVGSSSDPLQALADRYLRRVPCPRKMLPPERFQYIQEIMKGAEVQGAVIHNLKACDCHLYEYPYLKKRLEETGLPVLFFRGEETEAEQETQREDIEAFIEMIKGN